MEVDPQEVFDRPFVRYPWDEWSDGRARILVRGTDFFVDATQVRTSAYGAARARGLKVRTRVMPEGNLAIQFYKEADDG